MATINVEDAKFNPARFFKRPADVVKDDHFSRKDKIEILRSWAYDEKDKSVAEEENMAAPSEAKRSILDEVSKALLELGAEDEKRPAPTKQG